MKVTNVTETELYIIGGESVQNRDLKYQLSLRLHRFHHCGACLVQIEGVQFALTAAHCVEDTSAQNHILVAGDIRISDLDVKEQARQVSKIVIHEKYESETFANDIARLFYKTAFQLNEWVGTIKLPSQGQDTKGKANVSGWVVYHKR